MHDTGSLAISICDANGRPFRAIGLSSWLTTIAPARARGTVTVAFVSDARMRVLNRTWRGIDRPTDVLSFPGWSRDATDRSAKALRGAPGARGRGQAHLGDIVIATGIAARQAREASHPMSVEWRVLALHGLLHLLGYDHEDPHDDGRMARAEARLRRKGGLRDGLISRRRSLDRAELRRGTLDGPARRRQRLRPARAAGGQRGAAAPARVRERGWGPASRKK
jgi:probable rRNA maturation factor